MSISFFWTTVFMVMVFWRPQEWLFPWMFGWPVLDVVVGIAVMALHVDVNEGRTRIPKYLPQLGLLFGLWISAPISHLPHTYVLGAWQSIMPVFTVCFFTYLLICVLDSLWRLRVVATIFVVMGLTIAYHASLQVTRGYGFGRCFPYIIEATVEKASYIRTCFYGIFNDPNDLGQLFVVCTPFCFALWKRQNIFTLAISVAMAYYLYAAMLTTVSRGAQVGFVAIVGAQLILLLPHRWFPVLLGLGLLGFLALCPFSGAWLDTSAHDRVVYWGLANQRFIHNPIFGIGYGMSWELTRKGEALHNCFVVCYTELGLFGYWFWFLLLQLGILGAWRTRGALRGLKSESAKYLRRLAGLTITATIGFCASGYFLARTFVFPIFFLMAMLASLPVLARAHLPPQRLVAFDRRRDLYVWGTAGALISVIYVYMSCRLLNLAYGG